MMYGSMLFNFWAALVSFSLYFLWAMQATFPMPLPTLVSSLVAAIIGFVVMYPIRLLFGYVFYTPESIVFSDVLNETSQQEGMNTNSQMNRPENSSTVEFEDDNPEEIAQVVRTMLHKEDEAVAS